MGNGVWGAQGAQEKVIGKRCSNLCAGVTKLQAPACA